MYVGPGAVADGSGARTKGGLKGYVSLDSGMTTGPSQARLSAVTGLGAGVVGGPPPSASSGAGRVGLELAPLGESSRALPAGANGSAPSATGADASAAPAAGAAPALGSKPRSSVSGSTKQLMNSHHSFTHGAGADGKSQGAARPGVGRQPTISRHDSNNGGKIKACFAGGVWACVMQQLNGDCGVVWC